MFSTLLLTSRCCLLLSSGQNCCQCLLDCTVLCGVQCRQQLQLAGDIHSQLSRLQAALAEHKQQEKQRKNRESAAAAADAEQQVSLLASPKERWVLKKLGRHLCCSCISSCTACLAMLHR